MQDTTICIFTKPPRPGGTKTRLIPALGAEQAARVAEALLADAIDAARGVPNATVVISSTEPFNPPEPALAVWGQPKGDLGIRLETTLQCALARSSQALAIGADTPGLTPAKLQRALQLLQSRDAVLGPAKDGGYYLVGLRRCPDGLFEGIRWSTRATRSDTLRRFKLFGISHALAPRWFDLDTPEDLAQVEYLLEREEIWAPRLRSVLHSMETPSERVVV